jgi:hypothetical protein
VQNRGIVENANPREMTPAIWLRRQKGSSLLESKKEERLPWGTAASVECASGGNGGGNEAFLLALLGVQIVNFGKVLAASELLGRLPFLGCHLILLTRTRR